MHVIELVYVAVTHQGINSCKKLWKPNLIDAFYIPPLIKNEDYKCMQVGIFMKGIVWPAVYVKTSHHLHNCSLLYYLYRK